MDKELLKKLRKSLQDYLAEHPTPTSILAEAEHFINEMDAAKIPSKEQLKILRDNGLKVAESAFWKWRKNRKCNS
jgi:hypothetical protein